MKKNKPINRLIKKEISTDILNYIELIDSKTQEALTNNVGRFSQDWGIWSRDMNVEIRKKIESGDHPQRPLLKQILPYWLNRSALIELKHQNENNAKSRLKIKALEKEGHRLRRNILQGKIAGIKLSAIDIIRSHLKGG